MSCLPTSLPESTPFRNTCNSASKYAAVKASRGKLLENMDSEMRKNFVGPMPVKKFFEAFLPIELHDGLPQQPQEFVEMANVTSEKDMYAKFVSAANLICKSIKAFDKSEKPSSEDDAKLKPDIVFYHATAKDEESETSVTSFQRMEMFAEFKIRNAADPFQSNQKLPFEKLSGKSCDTRGQIIAYATRLQSYQFRTCFFSIGIFGKVARLFRWDRAGAVVSDPIDYTKAGNLELVEFLARFDSSDSAQRGSDPTVSQATPRDSKAFENAIKAAVGDKESSLLGELLAAVGDGVQYPRRKVDVPGDNGVASYIVGRPLKPVKSPIGRATRGFIAWSKTTKELVFLKDSWRPNVEGMEGEAQLFEKLKAVRNISAFLHGSDVRRVTTRRRVTAQAADPTTDPPHHTLTDSYSKSFGVFAEMMGYIHYRTIQREFYIPLEMFTDSKHLVQIILDVVIAIEDLYAQDILHRNISVSNIMININGRGHLIDLDMARSVTGGARLSKRTGTWQFISTRLLTKPGKLHQLCDDLESLWFVFLYEALHFIKHNEPEIYMKSVFDQRQVCRKTETHTGGMGKESLYCSGDIVMGKTLQYESEPFTALTRKFFFLFRTLNEYYRAIDREEEPRGPTLSGYEKLGSCAEMKRLLKEALKSTGWPEACDKVKDQYPPRGKGKKTPQEKNAVAMSHVIRPLPRSIADPSGTKRKREGVEMEEDHPAPAQKRPNFQPRLGQMVLKFLGLSRD